ncbi:hypothetical protein OHB05_00305 [Streptomyces sp. NBC_00638]|uniref:hypothetical protein n=1 Tax=unclassified Streptomyces TaxID=2593676 RepID=UPI002250785F|nr:hypothetical protein [Streptomyces sp. NBC_00638]MCX5001072.1 hypothetical protein [Streptomyces sp. NBC_00638]
MRRRLSSLASHPIPSHGDLSLSAVVGRTGRPRRSPQHVITGHAADRHEAVRIALEVYDAAAATQQAGSSGTLVLFTVAEIRRLLATRPAHHFASTQ